MQSSGVVVAHGLGDASALPLPLQLVLPLVGASVLGLAALVSRRSGGAAVSPRVAPGGRRLPRLTRVADAPVTRTLVRAAGLVAGLGLVVLAALGPAAADGNPAPRLLLVVVWAGLLPLALVAPGAYRAANPLRTLAAGVARVPGGPDPGGPDRGGADRGDGPAAPRPLPAGLGIWPAAVALAVLLLLETAGGTPTTVLVFLVLHGLVQVACAAVYGPRWLTAADPFEVTADLVGRLSPVGRAPDGVLALSSPRPRLAAAVPPGTVAVVALLVGSSLADFAVDTAWWADLTYGSRGVAATLVGWAGVAAWTALAAAVLTAGTRVRVLTPAIVPLVTAYGVAHYFAVLLVEGQVAFAQLGAVLRGGLEAVTAAALVADYELLPGGLAATAQLLGFVVPHLVAVVVAADLASAAFSARSAGAAQVGLRAVLVASAVGGTLLRYSAA